MGNPSYFGVKLGESIAAGARHISDALQRKYEMQAQQEEKAQALARQEEQRLKAEQLAFAPYNVYLPGKPKSVAWGPLGKDQSIMGYTEEQLGPIMKKAQEEANLSRRMKEAEISKMGQQKIPTNYMWNPSGTAIVAIPGSPAAQKEELAKTNRIDQDQKKVETQQSFIDNIDNALSAIEEARGNVGTMSTGVIGGKLIGITPKASNLKANIDTINSFIGLGKLMEMKSQSKNGASGFGALSEKELALLTSSVRSLDQKLVDPEKMMENLNTISSLASKWRERTAGKMEMTNNVNSGRIKVKKKSNGETGTIESSEFNDSEYERI
jgi:hypothetical protein